MARRTAKQKAATRKLVARNRRRGSAFFKRVKRSQRKESGGKRKRSSTRRTKNKPLAKKKSFRTKSKSGIKTIFRSGLLGKAVLGVGAATIAGVALNRFAPQFAGIGMPIAAFLSGGPIGVISSLLLQGGLNLGGLFGGGTASSNINGDAV